MSSCVKTSVATHVELCLDECRGSVMTMSSCVKTSVATHVELCLDECHDNVELCQDECRDIGSSSNTPVGIHGFGPSNPHFRIYASF